jgi:hypothetical protein
MIFARVCYASYGPAKQSSTTKSKPSSACSDRGEFGGHSKRPEYSRHFRYASSFAAEKEDSWRGRRFLFATSAARRSPRGRERPCVSRIQTRAAAQRPQTCAIRAPEAFRARPSHGEGGDQRREPPPNVAGGTSRFPQDLLHWSAPRTGAPRRAKPCFPLTGETVFPPWAPFFRRSPTPRFVSLPAGKASLRRRFRP